MDPTRQRRQTPLKAALDFFVWAASTYLMPACATCAVLLILERTTANLYVVVACGAAHYWAVAYEATTAYRRDLALPRAFDLSLDPPSQFYLEALVYRCLIASSVPLLLVFLPARFTPWTPAIIGSLLIWSVTATRELIHAQTKGTAYLQDGTRGNRLKPVGLLRKMLEASSQPNQPRIWWGGLQLDLKELLKNFLVVGSVGTGKTLILKAFLRCVLPLVIRYSRWRMLIVDPKSELYPYLLNFVPRYKIKILNAGDARTHAGAINADIRHEKHIHEASHILIPRLKQESQPYFTDGARRLLAGVIQSFVLLAPDDWRFSDIFIAARSPKRIRTLLGIHQATRDILQAYDQNQRTFFDIYSTLDSRLADYYPIASVWSHLQREEPSRTVSLTEFVDGNFVILIGKQASAGTSQGRFIQLFLSRCSQLLLDQPTGQSTQDPHTASYTIIAVDEAPRAGKLSILDVLTGGRDHGISFAVLTQSLDAMLEHYPKAHWDALGNEFHSLALLSANSPTTVQWMSKRLGNIDGIQPRPDAHGGTTGQVGWIPTLDPTQFQNLAHGKKVGPTCIPGIFLNSKLGAWYCSEGVDLPPPMPGTPAIEPIPDRWQTLRLWDEEDLRRLNLTHLRDELDLDGDGSGPAAQVPQGPTNRPLQPTLSQFPRFQT